MNKGQLAVFKNLGNEIRRRRKALNWSQEKLADVSGVAFNHISRLERGVTNPRLSTLHQITEAMKCTLGDLLNFTGSTPLRLTVESAFTELQKLIKDKPIKHQLEYISKMIEALKKARS